MADTEKVRVLTLDEVMNGSGKGYEEDWLPPDDDDPAIKTLKPCVYLMGDVLEFDEQYKYCDRTEPDFTAKHYDEKYRFRIWTGKPTEQQREETEWSR